MLHCVTTGNIIIKAESLYKRGGGAAHTLEKDINNSAAMTPASPLSTLQQNKTARLCNSLFSQAVRPQKPATFLHSSELGSLSHPYLEQAVANQCYQQLVSKSLPDQSSVVRGIHVCEVKHRYIWLPAVVHGKIQRGKLVVGAKVSSLSGIAQKSFLVDICTAQQHLGVYVILFNTSMRVRSLNTENLNISKKIKTVIYCCLRGILLFFKSCRWK